MPNHTNLLNFFVGPEPVETVIDEEFMEGADVVLVDSFKVGFVGGGWVVASGEVVVGFAPELGDGGPGGLRGGGADDAGDGAGGGI